jgi:hypothetical protein
MGAEVTGVSSMPMKGSLFRGVITWACSGTDPACE